MLAKIRIAFVPTEPAPGRASTCKAEGRLSRGVRATMRTLTSEPGHVGAVAVGALVLARKDVGYRRNRCLGTEQWDCQLGGLAGIFSIDSALDQRRGRLLYQPPRLVRTALQRRCPRHRQSIPPLWH
jgi:hypothetical protein